VLTKVNKKINIKDMGLHLTVLIEMT